MRFLRLRVRGRKQAGRAKRIRAILQYCPLLFNGQAEPTTPPLRCCYSPFNYFTSLTRLSWKFYTPIMVKLRAPLLSLGASNSLSRAITFVKRRGQNIAEKKPVVPDQKTAAQLSWRHMYQKCAALWHDLSAEERKDWESLGTARHMTGFAYWQSQCLRPNPGIYLPLQGGTMQGDIDMAGYKIEDLPDPSLDQDAATKAYVDLAVANLHWDYAFSNTASGIGAYFKMFTEPTGEAESTFTSGAMGAGDDQALFQWISDAAVPFATIEAGVISLHIHAERTSGTKSVNLYAEIYEYTNLAAEVLIGTTEISAAVTDVDSSLAFHASLSVDYEIALTSRLLVKFYANVGAAGANATVALYAEGTTSSRVSVPTPTGAFSDHFLKIIDYAPGARVWNNAQQVIPNNSVTALAFNQERWDTDNIHDNATNNSRLTCRTAGKYIIVGQVTWLSNVTGPRNIYIRHQGAVDIGVAFYDPTNMPTPRTSVATIYDLAVGEYVELRVYQFSTAPLNTSVNSNYSPEFMMQRIGT